MIIFNIKLLYENISPIFFLGISYISHINFRHSIQNKYIKHDTMYSYILHYDIHHPTYKISGMQKNDLVFSIEI